MRVRNIDLLKGSLIILVIIGHVLQGKLSESISRYLIYSFHMPLFIGISGYLFNINKISSLTFIEIVEKYKFRVIIPWLIASIFYLLLFEFRKILFPNVILSFKNFLPNNHLWFIPAFLSWIFLTWTLKKWKMSDQQILIISILLSLIFYVLKSVEPCYAHIQNLGILIKSFILTFRPYFYIFFVIGMVYRNIILNKPIKIELFLPVILLIIQIFLFFLPNDILGGINFYLLNFFLLNAMLKIAKNEILPKSTIFEWLGINSLGIYLWHLIPIVVITSFFKFEIQYYYLVTTLSEFLFLLIYAMLLKNSFFKKYMFGL